MSNFYREDDFNRYWQGLKVSYGLTHKFEIGITGGASNHNHPGLVSELFQNTDPNHDHNSHNHNSGDPGADSTDQATNPEHQHRMEFTGLQLYTQYRFFNRDGPKRHFRIATYQTLSSNFTTHNFAEPNLLHRTAGIGGGLIFTGLYKQMAASARVGGILPFGFREKDSDRYFRSGNALDYALSLGYLLYPRSYKGYDQLNINLYAEFMGKWYGAATIYEGSVFRYPWKYPSLNRNTYLEARPGIQFIFKSKVRVGVSTALPVFSRSYAMEYPQIQLNVLWLILR